MAQQKKLRVKLARKLRKASKDVSFSAAHKAARLFVSGRAQDESPMDLVSLLLDLGLPARMVTDYRPDPVLKVQYHFVTVFIGDYEYCGYDFSYGDDY
jgi:hypothetical protein